MIISGLVAFLIFASLLHIIGSIKESLLLPLFVPLLYIVIRFMLDLFPLIPYGWEISLLIILSIGIFTIQKVYIKIKELLLLYQSLPPPPKKEPISI